MTTEQLLLRLLHTPEGVTANGFRLFIQVPDEETAELFYAEATETRLHSFQLYEFSALENLLLFVTRGLS